MPNKIEIVQAMEAAAFAGDWEKFKSFFADDVYFRVGNVAEVRGPQAAADYMSEMLDSRLTVNDLQVRAGWETEDTVVLEMNMQGLRHRDHRNVAFPCLDVYHFDGDKINDWRVYAIEPTNVV
ncbi:MAG: nuclear transport factor 2 family protein [Deltaproteobacteria bacterium]|nr:nuclear transport factor 2 family protein [Deltaproteobacteria bacterium]